MRKLIAAAALALAGAVLVPTAAYAEEGVPGTCQGTDELSYTPPGAKLDRIDKNANWYICVHPVLKKNGDYRLTYYDDTI